MYLYYNCTVNYSDGSGTYSKLRFRNLKEVLNVSLNQAFFINRDFFFVVLIVWRKGLV